MNLKQLTYIREVARQSLNISKAADALHTSQPGVSRQIQMLEEELGVSVLKRRKNRTLGFTDFGNAILESSQRILNEMDAIKQMAAEARRAGERLLIVTTHMHARFTLLNPVWKYLAAYPEVQLELHTVEPKEVCRIVAAGDADLGISTESSFDHELLHQLPGERMRRILIMPKGHELGRRQDINLDVICDYPTVTYSPGSGTGRLINETLKAKGQKPRFIISASDIYLVEAYVEKELCVAILPGIVSDATSTERFDFRDVTNLFPSTSITLSFSRDVYLKKCAYNFIDMVPGFSKAEAQKTIKSAAE